MSGFKVGDKVRCIDDSLDADGGAKRLAVGPTKGRTYTVADAYGDIIDIDATPPDGWLARRFEPVSEWQVGDRVELIPERKQDRRIDRKGVRRFMHWPGGEVVSIASDGTAYIDRHESIPLSERRYYRVVQPEPQVDAPVDATIPFKPGTWVTYQGSVEVGTVVGYRVGAYSVRVRWNRNGFDAWYRPEHLSEWEPAEAPADTLTVTLPADTVRHIVANGTVMASSVPERNDVRAIVAACAAALEQDR